MLKLEKNIPRSIQSMPDQKRLASADKTEKELEMLEAECYQKVRQQNEKISEQPNMQQYDVRKAKSADF